MTVENQCPTCNGVGTLRTYCPCCGTHTGTHWYDYCPPMPERPTCGDCKGTGKETSSMRNSVKDVKYIDIHSFDTTPVYGAKFDFYASLSFDQADNWSKPGQNEVLTYSVPEFGKDCTVEGPWHLEEDRFMSDEELIEGVRVWEKDPTETNMPYIEGVLLDLYNRGEIDAGTYVIKFWW